MFNTGNDPPPYTSGTGNQVGYMNLFHQKYSIDAY